MFHVPEQSRVTRGDFATSAAREGNNGLFYVASCEPGWTLTIIATDGSMPDARDNPDWQWEHVSVHAYRLGGGYAMVRQKRTPTWKEMCQVKDLFWDDEDVVMQLHPRRSEYRNYHPNVLHLWRPKLTTIPTPPPILVAPEE